MRPARIYNDRLYLMGFEQGISGFRKGERLILVTGRRYRRDLGWLNPGPRLGNLNARQWRLEDGHLPDYQPIVSYDEACRWVEANPFSCATAV